MKDLTFNGAYPVARFSNVRAHGIDETCDAFKRLVREHEILTYGSHRCLAEIHYAPLQKMAVSSVSLNTEITARVQAVKDSSLIFTLLDGEVGIAIDGRKFNVRENKIVVVPAGVPFSLDIPDKNQSVILEIDQGHLNSFTSKDTGATRLDLMALNMSIATVETRAGVARLLRFLRDELQNDSPLLRNAGYVDRLEDLITCSLIHAVSDSMQVGEIRHDCKSLPRYMRRAVEYLHDHAETPPTLRALSQVAATSSRTLIRGFNRYLGLSPIAYLRDIRLQRAHEDLCRSMPEDVSVTSIAHKWNFFHLGRFTTLYKTRFGQSPAESLRTRSG
jgi:AraC-like DNA-binding protein/mannose-6-phosphate isomerase-like protein (cupin superfamily)